MHIESVNVGLPREVTWRGMAVRTAIFKHPVSHPVAIATLNLAGDRQADLNVHGGAYKAVYAYPAEHYSYWREQLADATLLPGYFGENLTSNGLLEKSLCIGDRLRVGSATLTVTQPRMPCYKLELRSGRDNMIRRFLASRRTGIYFSVAEVGEVEAGSPVELLDRDPEHVTVRDLLDLFMGQARDRGLLERALRCAALPVEWKHALRQRFEAREASASQSQ